MHKTFSFFLLIVTVVLFASCKDKIVDNPVGNKAPTTKLFLSPDSSLAQQPSKIRLFWSGDDPDGFIIGYYFSWDGLDWSFTSSNDSLFALQIGAADTSFVFRISSVDNSGNGIYDSQVERNGINFGTEPFNDLNGNNTWESGETYYDIGLVDPNPAQLTIPIKNSAPTVEWEITSTIPAVSFSAMSFGWTAHDLDGDQTIANIRISLNDTNNAVLLSGGVSRITIRTKDFTNPAPLMDILINQDANNVSTTKLPGLIFDTNNKFFVQAVDISGAKSPWLSLPDSTHNWFVKKPKGEFLIVDDYRIGDNAATFYSSMMDSIGLANKFDVYDISPTQLIPYKNPTFLETIKLFKGILWYTDYISPSLDLANAAVQRYLDFGGKIFFSMQFPAIVDLTQIQGFLPILPDSSSFANFFETGSILRDTSHLGYPTLEANESSPKPKGFYLPNIGVTAIYYDPSFVLQGFVGFESDAKNLFFIGLPLNKLNGIPGSIRSLLYKVLHDDFNLIP